MAEHMTAAYERRRVRTENRLRKRMRATLTSNQVSLEREDNLYLLDDLLDGLVKDAMREIIPLIAEADR